ncbi:hypothetical protein GCM10007962_32120 [Yeosuana aromativorans]|uniref:Uncharacterized protein n=1 Tax=Yeosuana aromativorans TaxID=288019 RepID=A0A8J3BSV4_9FLAO|nr:hypothetical protein [Yeosuana aromativorans]GGK35304.1 hypothetical protein GCM10007962_32120 [Yeosuana aromativorans]
MKTNYLLPNKYKTLGWVLFIVGIIAGIIFTIEGYETNLLTTKVLSIYDGLNISVDGKISFFNIQENSIVDELITIAIIIGGLIVGFSREKVEDEFIYKLRKDSLVWAIIVNYAILLFVTLFIYDLAYFHVLVFNMFTPLIFFIVRFNFLKLKSNSNEE